MIGFEICNSYLSVKRIRHTDVPVLGRQTDRRRRDSLEVLVLSGGADLGGVALGQLVQAPGVLELELGLSTEELLQVLQQLQPGLGLLLQTTELLHQLVADLCISKREDHLQNKWSLSGGSGAYTLGLTSACQTVPQVSV